MEVEIIDNKQQRAQLATRTDVLDRVKKLATVPNHEFATTEQVAEFYGIELKTLRSTLGYHRDEFKATGYRVVSGHELRKLKTELELQALFRQTKTIALWDRKAVLLLGMLLRDSEVAKTVRRYLLAAEGKAHEIATAPKGSVVEMRPDEYTSILDKLMYTVNTSSKTVQAVLEQNGHLIRLLLGDRIEGPKTVTVFGPEYVSTDLGLPLVKGGAELRTGFKNGTPWAGWFGKGKVEWVDWPSVISSYRRFKAQSVAA